MMGVTTPFDDPQAELAWMFLQNLSDDGDLDEGFALLSEDFTYWNNTTRAVLDRAGLRHYTERFRSVVRLEFDLLSCVNGGQNVAIEAQADGVTSAGVHYDAPAVYLFETRAGLITSLREYGDPRLIEAAFGDVLS
jgi:uncharacterized protein